MSNCPIVQQLSQCTAVCQRSPWLITDSEVYFAGQYNAFDTTHPPILGYASWPKMGDDENAHRKTLKQRGLLLLLLLWAEVL